MDSALSCREHLPREEALQILRDRFAPLPARPVPLEQASGEVLAEEVVGARNVPHYPAAAVDGYALASEDTAQASPARPVLLSRDRFCWVNTGGAVPPSCDAVVMVEDTSEGPDGLVVVRATPRGQNVRPVGEDVLAGQVLARPGDPVTPALQALLLCAGVREIPALPKPRVLFIPTGDEILSVEEWFRSGATPPPGTVVESNSLLLRGLFRGWGMDLHVHPLVPDDPVQIRQALDEGAESYDVVLLGAGSAKGKRDHSASVLREGGGLLFRWLLMKPGRPAMGGAWKGKPVLVLPGFPMSTAVVAWGLVHPFLEHLASSSVPSGEELCSSLGCGEPQECRLLVPLSSAQGMEDWVRLKCARIRDQVVAWPLSTGASSLFALAECDALGVLPRETLELPKGSPLSFYTLKRMDLDRTVLFQGSDDPAFQRLASRVRLRGAQVAIRTVGSLGGLRRWLGGRPTWRPAIFWIPRPESTTIPFWLSSTPRDSGGVDASITGNRGSSCLRGTLWVFGPSETWRRGGFGWPTVNLGRGLGCSWTTFWGGRGSLLRDWKATISSASPTWRRPIGWQAVRRM